MIKIAVIDSSAESRSRMLDQLDSFLKNGIPEVQLLPRINLKPVSPQEMKFNSAPDICLVGSEVVEGDISEIARIKKLFPNSPIIVWLNQSLSNLSVIEQIARQGADDVLTFDASAQYFFRRILMLSRKAVHQSSGKLIVVDGGKGGVGVTTIAAALAELISSNAKRVVVIDCDFETQDCSRFLQSRPFLNENLRLLLDDERAITEESVEQCLSAVWQDDNFMRCMAPVAEGEDLYDPRSRLPRNFLSVLEVLDSNNDFIIIDIGCARSSLQKMLYRVADKLIFIVNDDPASLYASVDKLTRARTQLSAGAQLCVVENSLGLSGLGNKLLRKEFSRAAKLEDVHWSPEPIAFCKTGQRWPGSGATFFTQAKAASAKSLEKLAISLSLIDSIGTTRGMTGLFSKFGRTDQKQTNPAINSYGDDMIQAGDEKPMILLESDIGVSNRILQAQIANHQKVIKQNKAEQTTFKKVVNGEDFNLEVMVGAAKPH